MKIHARRSVCISLLLVVILYGSISASSQQPAKADFPDPQGAAGESTQASSGAQPCRAQNVSTPELKVAVAMAQNGDFDDAIVLFKSVLKCDPNLAEAHYDLGLALLGASDSPNSWTIAMEQFREALKIRSNYAEARDMLGVGMMVIGNPKGAIKELQIAALEAPGNAEIHLNLGKAFVEVAQWSHAVGELRKAIELEHPYPEAEADLGTALLNEGSTASAKVAFRAALRGNPDLESAHYGLARVLKAEGKSAAATIEFQEARLLLQRKSDAVMSSSLSNQSLKLAAQGSAAQAAATAKRAVELDPDSWMAVYNYGLLLADMGELDRGIDEMRLAISLMPMRRQLYMTMAQMQKQSGYAGAAECSLLRANDLVQFATAHNPQAAQTLETKKCRAMDRDFAFGASFGDIKERSAYARYLSIKGDLLGAAGELLYSIRRAPTEPDVRYDLAIVWLQMGKLKSSEMELRDALILAPQSSKANFALGAVLVQLQEYGEAKERLRRALILDPGNAEARRMLDELADHEK